MQRPLIVFSGIDGGGKSTQINLLQRRLQENGLRPVYLWTRGGYTPLFETIKHWSRFLSRGRAVPQSGHSTQRAQAFSRPWVRRVWLWIALIDLVWVYAVQIRWWRWRGRPVICDRYLWDTLVDFRLNFPDEQVENWLLWRLLARWSPTPDTAFLLLIPVDESLRRSKQKDEPFPDSPETLAKRLEQYQKLADEGHWRALDGLRPLNELAEEIWSVVNSANPMTAAVTA